MPEPINYLSMMPNVDPVGGLMEGLQAGYTLRGLKQQSEDRDIALKQKQDAEARTEQYRTSMNDYMQTPSIEKLRNLQVMFPEQEKAFKPLIDQMDKKQLMAEQSAGTQIVSAIKQNDLDTANKILDQAIEAGTNSGIDTSAFTNVKQSLAQNPTGALGMAQWMLYHTMTPEQQEKFAKSQQTIEETAQSQELFPSKKREATAKAGTAESEQTIKGVEAKYIEPKTLQAIQKTGIEMKGLLADIDYKRKMAQISALNAQTAKEGNSLKRKELELKIQDKTNDLNTKLQERASKAQSALTNSDNILNTIDRVLAIPKNVKKAAHGPIDARLPTVQRDVSDYENLLDTLGSQAFTSVVQEIGGMSGLTEVEGNKLQKGLQNLSLSQSPEQADLNTRELKKLMLKSRKNLETKYGIKASPPEASFMSDANAKSVFEKYGIK